MGGGARPLSFFSFFLQSSALDFSALSFPTLLAGVFILGLSLPVAFSHIRLQTFYLTSDLHLPPQQPYFLDFTATENRCLCETVKLF